MDWVEEKTVALDVVYVEWRAGEGQELYVSRLDNNRYDWEIMISEFVIRGGYPGYPDSNDTIVGSGTESTLLEAKWKAERCWDRFLIAQNVISEEENAWYDEYYAQQEEFERNANVVIDGKTYWGNEESWER